MNERGDQVYKYPSQLFGFLMGTAFGLGITVLLFAIESIIHICGLTTDSIQRAMIPFTISLVVGITIQGWTTRLLNKLSILPGIYRFWYYVGYIGFSVIQTLVMYFGYISG